MVDKILNITKQLNLIKSEEDIEFLFNNYKNDISLSFNKQIEKALKWAYKNDSLDIFFIEYHDKIKGSEVQKLIISCQLDNQTSSTSFHLYQSETQNMYCYFVYCFGGLAHMWEETRFWISKENHYVKSVINDFKGYCYEISYNHRELSDNDSDEINANIEFKYND